jgi:hypothetical protein
VLFNILITAVRSFGVVFLVLFYFTKMFDHLH